MSNIELPALPASTHCIPYPGPEDIVFTPDQMRSYALEAVAADRERQAGEAVACTTERLTELAKPIATAIAKNCSVAPQLVFPHLFLGLKDLFASLPAPQAVQAGPTHTEVYAEGRGDQFKDDCAVIQLLLENCDDADTYGDGQMNTTRIRELLTHFDTALAAAPSPDGKAEQAEAREEQWRVVTWSSKTDRTFTKRDEALEYLRANDTDGDWHIEPVQDKKTTIYDGWFGEQAEAPSAMRTPPEPGTDYWRLMSTGGWLHTWTGDSEDYDYLRNGLAFATREALACAQNGAA